MKYEIEFSFNHMKVLPNEGETRFAKPWIEFSSTKKAFEKNLTHSATLNCGRAHPCLISREIKYICFSFVYTQLTKLLVSPSSGPKKLHRLCSHVCDACCSQLTGKWA